MPQPKKGPRFGSGPKHQKLMMRNLALSLFEHERVRTTEAKAKALRPFAERLITKAKTDDLHHRRQVLSEIEDRSIVHKLFADIGPRFAGRAGGYTRVLKLGTRSGDGAAMAIIELVEGARPVAGDDEDAETARRRRIRRPARPAGRSPEARAADEAPGEDDEEVVEESREEASDEASGEEPTGAPGDAVAPTSQDEPGEDEQTS
ncbi:MAG TPA: 50S ribosomal protein L17 [Actinomycetota bacterium]|nr:50S ribosomal protein L17 [Actinomycetota bacterium]